MDATDDTTPAPGPPHSPDIHALVSHELHPDRIEAANRSLVVDRELEADFLRGVKKLRDALYHSPGLADRVVREMFATEAGHRAIATILKSQPSGVNVSATSALMSAILRTVPLRSVMTESEATEVATFHALLLNDIDDFPYDDYISFLYKVDDAWLRLVVPDPEIAKEGPLLYAVGRVLKTSVHPWGHDTSVVPPWRTLSIEMRAVLHYPSRITSISVLFRARSTMPLEVCFLRFAQEQGIEPSELTFHYNGAPISPEQTAGDLGIESGDIIQVTHQPSAASAAVMRAHRQRGRTRRGGYV